MPEQHTAARTWEITVVGWFVYLGSGVTEHAKLMVETSKPSSVLSRNK